MKKFFFKTARSKRCAALFLCVIFFAQVAVPFGVQASDINATSVTEGGVTQAPANILTGDLLEDIASIIDTRLYLGNTEITSGATVSYNDSLTLKYEFTISQQTGEAIKSMINSGSNPRCVIPLPNGLSWSESLIATELFVADKDGAYSEKFAQLSFEGGIAYITFTGEFWNDPSDIDEGWLELKCFLDPAATKDLPAYEFNLLGNKKISILIQENKKSEHMLSKSGDYRDNRFNWEVSYIPGQEDAKYPLVIKDEFDNSCHIFVPGSLAVIPGVTAASIQTVGNITTISYTIEEDAKDLPVTLTYQTRLADGELPSDGSNAVKDTTAVNKVSLLDADAKDVVSPVTRSVTVPLEQKRWMYKTGVQNGRNIDWTITISSLDRDLINLMLFDAIPAGLTLIDDSVRINGKTVSGANAVLINAPGAANGGYAASFAIGFNGSPYPPLYTVKYSTAVSDGYFDNPNQDSTFNNAAWLTFDWQKYGSGSGYIALTSPVVGKDFGAVTNAISKTAVKYNASTHTITWKIDVNPYHVNIFSGTITDDLSAFRQSFAGNFQSSDNSIIKFNNAYNNIVNVSVGAIGTDEGWFTFDAFVENPDDFYANHDGKTYNNTADFVGRLDSESGQIIEDSSSSWVNVTSQMLTKSGGGFSYNKSGELEITWKLTANQNKTQLSNAIIEDALPDGLSYVAGSLKINDVTSTAIMIAGKKITISLGDEVSDTVTVEYRTRVNPDDPALSPLFTSDNKISITNIAELIHDSYPGGVTAKGTQEIGNQILDKNGIYNLADKVISYTVDINPNGVTLSGQKIKDTLPSNLRLDITSVKLAEAEIQADGTLAKKTGGVGYNYDDAIFSYQLDGFGFSLPDGNKRYILTYDCYIVNGTSFNNTIKFTTDGVGDVPGSNSDSVDINTGGGGTSSKKARLVITKLDSERPGVKLTGVTFDVFQLVGGSEIPVMSLTTDGNGKADLYPLTPNAEYVIRETGIDGYDADTMNAGSTGAVAVNSISNGKLNIKVSAPGEHTLTVTNVPAKGGFSFEKRSDKAVQGDYKPVNAGEARFRAVDQTAGSDYAAEASTDAAGKVIFSGLPFGKYTVTEIITPQYHTAAAPFSVEIGSNGTTVTPSEYGNGTATLDNTFFRPALSIQKQNLGTSSSVGGIEFAIYKKGEADPIEIQSTNASGNLKFTQRLLGGESYVIREINTPNEFYISGEYETGVINSATLNTVIWKNYAHAASVEITKVDSMRTGVALTGAVFELYSDLSGSPGAILATSNAAGANGKIIFSGLALNQDTNNLKTNSQPALLETRFWIVEKTAPTGYTPDSTPIEVKFSSGSAYNAVISKTVENTPLKAGETSLTFYKRSDKDEAPLAGVAFTLTDTTKNSDLVLKATSGADGKVVFDNIPFGTYTLEETTAPKYHKKMQPVTVIFDETGKCVEFNGKINPSTEADFTIYNEIFTPKLTVTKINADTGAKIEGIWFDIYNSKNPAVICDSKQTDMNGQTSFNLLGGESYIIKERNAPEGYYVSADYSTGVINSETLAPVSWKNYAYAASIKITKRDGARTGILLKDAEFTLYSDEECTSPVGISKTTDGNGVLTFTGLPLNQTGGAWNGEPGLAATDYWLLETKAPEGYIINTTPVKVTLSDRKASYTTTLDNEPVRGNLTFTKISRSDDRADLPLAGAQFTLTDASGYSVAEMSGTNGAVNFRDLPFGTYTATETIVPSYHSKYPSFQITIDKNGKCTFFNGTSGSDLTDMKIINVQNLTELSITKLEENGAAMPEVKFTLYRKYGDAWQMDGSIQSTDANGKVRFGNIVVGETYKIHETAPEGYYDVPDYEFTARDIPEHSFTWVNERIKTDLAFTKVNGWDIPLAGAEFTLTGDLGNGRIYNETATSDQSGIVKFADVPFGTYTLTETKAPVDHELNNTAYAVEVSKSGDVTLPVDMAGGRFTDEFYSGSVSIMKMDDGANKPLEGVTFVIIDSNGIKRGTAVTDKNGIAVFSELMVNEVYTIEEKAVSGYYPSDPLIITALAKDEIRQITWNNYPCQGSVTVKVVDSATGVELSGVKFGIYSVDSQGNEVLVGEALSGNSGELVFEGLPLGTSKNATFDQGPTLDLNGAADYIIRELNSIKGYEPLTGQIAVSLTDSNPSIQEQVAKDKTPAPPPASGGRSGKGNIEVGGDADDKDNTEAGESGGKGNAGETGGGSSANYEPAQEPRTEIIEGVPVVIPEIPSVQEKDIIHPAQLPEGYSAVQIDGNTYTIYDEHGVPLGYVTLSQDMTLDDIDIMGEMISFDKKNPKTGESENAPDIWFWLIAILFVALSAIVSALYKRKRI